MNISKHIRARTLSDAKLYKKDITQHNHNVSEKTKKIVSEAYKINRGIR